MKGRPENSFLEQFSERFMDHVRQVCTFAKLIPGFKCLHHDDQVTLLKSCVFEVLLVRLAGLFENQVGDGGDTDDVVARVIYNSLRTMIYNLHREPFSGRRGMHVQIFWYLAVVRGIFVQCPISKPSTVAVGERRARADGRVRGEWFTLSPFHCVVRCRCCSPWPGALTQCCCVAAEPALAGTVIELFA